MRSHLILSGLMRQQIICAAIANARNDQRMPLMAGQRCRMLQYPFDRMNRGLQHYCTTSCTTNSTVILHHQLHHQLYSITAPPTLQYYCTTSCTANSTVLLHHQLHCQLYSITAPPAALPTLQHHYSTTAATTLQHHYSTATAPTACLQAVITSLMLHRCKEPAATFCCSLYRVCNSGLQTVRLWGSSVML